jgi:hypothetical protein
MTNPALKRRAKFSLPLRGSKSESNVAKNQFVQKLKLQTTGCWMLDAGYWEEALNPASSIEHPAASIY